MDKLMNQQVQARHSAEETYSAIRGCIITAQNKVATAVKTTMVFAYHEIVKQVYKATEKMTGLNMGNNCCNIFPST